MTDSILDDEGLISKAFLDTLTLEQLHRTQGRIMGMLNKNRKPRPIKSPVAIFLAGIPVNESATIKGYDLSYVISRHIKASARILLNDPSAMWRSRDTNQGVRVWRVS